MYCHLKDSGYRALICCTCSICGRVSRWFDIAQPQKYKYETTGCSRTHIWIVIMATYLHATRSRYEKGPFITSVCSL